MIDIPSVAQVQRITRRAFLGAMTAASASHFVPASARGADGAVAPSNRITLGLIGHGVMGAGHLAHAVGTSAVQVLAVCDVDRSRREEAQRRVEAAYAAARTSGTYSGCAAYNDYREILTRPDIDAVIIVTPDHWHAPIAAEAAAAGKDIYCEKPVSITIEEGRKMVSAVRRYGRVFQTGSQYRSNQTIRRVCDFVRAGGLGKVKAAFALWSRIHEFGGAPFPVDPPLPAEPIPDGLDWELWLGPAPWHPYNRRYHVNPPPGVVPWAFCEDFGAASVTWHHSHSADVIQYALGVETSGPTEIIPPGAGPFPTLTYRYANGTLLHLVEHWGLVKELYSAVPQSARLAGSFGGIFVGERGWVTSMTTGGPIEGEPETIFEEMGLREREITGANNHHANWLDCIRTRALPSSNEEIGHRAASLGHLATIGFRLGRALRWNPNREEFDNDPEANRLLSRAMRESWRI
ncbi:MAG TPA: Gfo/Idh/MocA family oxidoreductase [Verrucomicrobiae bacterium]|nr:Gfo/Idh/MocA family oxidoreductase [Verrucomicrobiae bacterium]